MATCRHTIYEGPAFVGPQSQVGEHGGIRLAARDISSHEASRSVDDSDLVRRLASGEEEAFRLLYDRYAAVIYNHCYRLTGSASAAEDLAAVTFLEAWRRRSSYRLVEGSATPWLHGIAYNVARNYRRTSRRYRSALQRLAETRVEPDPASSLIEKVSAQQTIRQLMPAIRALPSRERETIELCAASGMSLQDAAALLGVPVGTVKSRLSRGLAKLRSSLDIELAKEGDS